MIVEPATEYVPGRHIDAIAEHLEAVSNGQLRKLLINVPPRHGKSTIVSVLWPAWVWTQNPSVRWLYSSYALGLSIRDNVKCRRLMQSPWYQDRWGQFVQFATDQNVKSKYENTRAGYRIATSVDSAVTGEGGDVVVVDDPHNAKKMPSEQIRESTLAWWDETMKTRLNDPRTGSRVIIMQRLHEQDLAGHVLEEGDWEHLCLPEEYDPMRHFVTTVGTDWRSEEGELLWPERIGPKEVTEFKTMGPYGYAAQYQQSPMPRGGGLFKRAWWQRYTVLPHLQRIEVFCDSAFKEGVGNDYSVFAVWGTDGLGSYYLLDLWRNKVEYPELMTAAHDVHAKHRGLGTLPLVIEDKASGQSAIQTLKRPLPVKDGEPLPALPVIAYSIPVGESKVARAEGITGLVEAGRVFLPYDAPWVEDFIAEHEKFPAGAHDDQVDTTSMALKRLSLVLRGGPTTLSSRPEFAGAGRRQFGA